MPPTFARLIAASREDPSTLNRRRRELPALVARPRRRTLQLAARRAADGATRHHGDVVHVQPEYVADAPPNSGDERVGRDRPARLADDHHAVRPPRPRRSERDNAAASHAGEIADRPLEILRVMLAAVDDDDVFGSTADEQFAVPEIPEVPGIQPPIADRLRGERIALIVPQH